MRGGAVTGGTGQTAEVGIDLERLVRAQQQGCAIGGSPLYTELLEAVAGDVAQRGPCRDILTDHADEPLAAAVVLRLLAGVHELVLTGAAPELASHYPSVGGTPGPDVGPTFLATVAEHRDLVVERTRRPIQTNEVGRSAALLGGFLVLAAEGRPLRVLEVGASAGLNLRFDRFRYQVGSVGFGPTDSPVRFEDPWADGTPDLGTTVQVVERRGCDARPLDPADPVDRLRLRACLWPDQPERRTRLDGALVVAEALPVPLDRADAATWAAAHLARVTPDTTTVVVHSIVTQYLDERTRAALEATIAAAGEAATPDAPMAWLRMEPSSVEAAEVRLTRWPGPGGEAPEHRVLAHSGFHGPPVRWHARPGVPTSPA